MESPHMRRSPKKTLRWRVALLLAALTAYIAVVLPESSGWQRFVDFLPLAGAQDKQVAEPAVPPKVVAPEKALRKTARCVFRIDVPLPIVDTVDAIVKGRIDRLLRTLPKSGERPIIVLEFRPKEGTAGEGSNFERSLALARYLSGDRLSHVQTVAFLPRTIKGHALLPVLACEQVVIKADADIGAAGIDETLVDEILRRGYSEIANRRRTVPAPVALGLLDKSLAVYKVTTPDGVRFELAENLPPLRAAGKVIKEDMLFREGDEHLLTGREMRAMSFASHLASDRRSLAAALQLPASAIQDSHVPEEGWKPILVDLDGPVHQQQVNFILRNLHDHVQRDDFNLLILRIQSAGGSIEQSLRLAQALADLDERYHTVALVEHQARADAALVAWACDELAVRDDAIVGGPGEGSAESAEIADFREPLEKLAGRLERDWSLPAALVDPKLEVFRYSQATSGDARYLSAEEFAGLPDPDAWQRAAKPLDLQQGLTGLAAEEVGLARYVVRNLDEFKSLYQLEGDLRPMRPNWALVAVEWLADPRIAGLLLFVAWFALMIEMSTPGVGVPGFIAGLCFLLYFWSQFLHGTAGWLEVLLFLGGFACLAVELLALPGTGIFGIGGGIMIIASIILASQTFIFPRNAYQLRQVPVSLFVLAAGLAGAVVSLVVIRRFLPETPYFNRMLLRPPEGEEREELSRRESLVAWNHLAGKRGTTTTQLTPSGKAQFGDELVDVIADGELIERGTAVCVVEVTGNRVLVRRA